jgi:hypothetical protein
MWLICLTTEAIFLQTGLDDPNQLDPSRKISTLAQRPERQLRAQDARLPSVSGLPHSVARLPTVKHARFRPFAQRFPTRVPPFI